LRFANQNVLDTTTSRGSDRQTRGSLIVQCALDFNWSYSAALFWGAKFHVHRNHTPTPEVLVSQAYMPPYVSNLYSHFEQTGITCSRGPLLILYTC